MNGTKAIAIEKLASAVSGSAARLKALWKPLAETLFLSLADERISPAKNVTICIEKGLLSIVYGSRMFSRIRVRGFKLYPVDGKYPGAEGLASSVSIALTELGVSKTDITLSIPKAWTLVKRAEFPATVKENISNVISYELDRLTPFNANEAFYDAKLLSEEVGKVTVLVTAAKADLLTSYLDALEEAGTHVTKLTMHLSGMGTLCRYIDKSEDFIFVKMGEKEYEGALFSRGSMTSVFTGVLEAREEREKLDILMSEIEPLLETGTTQGRPPKLFVSLKDKSSPLREMLKTRVRAPLRILEETDVVPGVPSQKIPSEALGVLIESLWPGAAGPNLLTKGREEKKTTPLMGTFILAAILILLLVIYIFSPVTVEERRLKEINHQITIRKEEVKKAEKVRKEVDALASEISTIEDFKAARPMALSIIRELTTVLPKSTWLTRLRITETTVELEGYANSATELLPILEASKYFVKAEFASPTFRDARLNSERFSIRMDIEGAKKPQEVKKPEGEKPKIGKK
ncbi:MAG TPA: PilN domain-containing protein [Thermodesulfovibrionales bacterium]|nr:PilN domain-containing protein [Thermodesulfovibrionales bacterium]